MPGGEPALIELKLETKAPIEIGDFVSVFTSLSGQFDKFAREAYPDLGADARIYVRELRPGSIIADMIPVVVPHAVALFGTVWPDVQKVLVQRFIAWLEGRLSGYLSGKGKVDGAGKSDLADFLGTVQAIANDPDGTAALSEVSYEDGKRKLKTALRFTTREAQAARNTIEGQRRDLEKSGATDHQRVVMAFTQSNIKDPGVGKRTGERVVIEAISPKELPLIYASNLAEQAIKSEIRDADDNVFKKGFVVDVNVELKAGKPAAYRVTHLHQVFDLPEDS